jgi:Xaa-Pro aminopeptidase
VDHMSKSANADVGRVSASIPFDANLLDRLMDDAGLDVLLATSKHAVQYLLGGHRFFFFDYMDAIGTDRYLPIVVYFKGHPEMTVYVGNEMENYVNEHSPFWPGELKLKAWGVGDAIALATAHILKSGLPATRIGVEYAFLPGSGFVALHSQIPGAKVLDALFVLERLRARKNNAELAELRVASDKVVDAMLSILPQLREGSSKNEIVQLMKEAEVTRGLNFEYCLIAMGSSLNRAPSGQTWRLGEPLSLDSGGNYGGYIGDVARMAVLGAPDAELVDLLGEIEDVQMKARSVVAPGTIGKAIYDAVDRDLKKSPNSKNLRFCAHGMGLITHEAPRLTSTGPVPYEATDADLPLEAGMVISIETTLLHPKRGFIKLEDTIAVIPDGYEAFGDQGRGWNVVA